MKDIFMILYCLGLSIVLLLVILFVALLISAFIFGPFLLAMFVHPAFSAIYVLYIWIAWIEGYKKKKK